MPALWFYADYGAESPFWNDRREMVWLETLSLSEELQEALENWANRAADEWDDPKIIEEGDELFQRAGHELGSRYVLHRGPRDAVD